MIKIFQGRTGGGDTFKTSSPYEKLLPLPTPFQDVLPKTGTILNQICVTQSTISFQKSDLYDNGTMSFTCEHSPNWQVFCPQIMAVVTLAFFPIV